MKALIICERGLEECEALIVYDLLTRAKIETILAGPTPTITSSHNLTFNVNEPLGLIDPAKYDCLVLPGGMPGIINLEKNNYVEELITHFVSNNKLIAAICSAPSLLIKKGLLKDNEFTCYPGYECGLESTRKKVTVHNNIITANGLGSTIEFGLKIIEALLGQNVASEIENKIQY